jgi:FkbM family methyltransferase
MFGPPGLTPRARATWLAHAWKALTRQHHMELAAVLRRFIGGDAVVFDAGSHAGQFSKLFARLAPAGQVYAFEPSEYARSILTLALRAHRLNGVEVVPAALGDAEGSLTLTTPIKSAGSVRYGLAHLGNGGGGGGGVRTETVPVTTLNAFVAEHGVGRFDFLKADIEGWEMRALVGGAAAIERHRPAMLLELIDGHLARAGDSLEHAWELLASWDYQPMEWTGGTGLKLMDAPRDGDSFWLPAERRYATTRAWR